MKDNVEKPINKDNSLCNDYSNTQMKQQCKNNKNNNFKSPDKKVSYLDESDQELLIKNKKNVKDIESLSNNSLVSKYDSNKNKEYSSYTIKRLLIGKSSALILKILIFGLIFAIIKQDEIILLVLPQYNNISTSKISLYIILIATIISCFLLSLIFFFPNIFEKCSSVEKTPLDSGSPVENNKCMSKNQKFKSTNNKKEVEKYQEKEFKKITCNIFGYKVVIANILIFIAFVLIEIGRTRISIKNNSSLSTKEKEEYNYNMNKDNVFYVFYIIPALHVIGFAILLSSYLKLLEIKRKGVTFSIIRSCFGLYLGFISVVIFMSCFYSLRIHLSSDMLSSNSIKTQTKNTRIYQTRNDSYIKHIDKDVKIISNNEMIALKGSNDTDSKRNLNKEQTDSKYTLDTAIIVLHFLLFLSVILFLHSHNDLFYSLIPIIFTISILLNRDVVEFNNFLFYMLILESISFFYILTTNITDMLQDTEDDKNNLNDSSEALLTLYNKQESEKM